MCLYTALGRLHPTHRIPTDARSYIDSLSLYTHIEPFEEMRWFRFLSLFRRPIDLSGTTEQRNVHDSLPSFSSTILFCLPSLSIGAVVGCPSLSLSRHTHYLWVAPAIDQVEAINTSELVSLLVERAVRSISRCGGAPVGHANN